MLWHKYKGDIFGGATAAVVALPLALAFGVASGAGALAGLYGAVFAGFFAAVFGGTKVQVSGPTGPMTVVMALVITHFAPNFAAAFTVVVLAGGLQILFGKLGFGGYIKLMPQPVVSGFMTGIGVIIIILQIAPLVGQVAPSGTILVKLTAIPSLWLWSQINYGAVALSGVTLAIMFLTPQRLAKIVPPALLAITVGTVAGVFIWGSAPVIGNIPSGFPSFQMPVLPINELPSIIKFAFMLAFLGSIDSLLTSLVADSITRTEHDSNKELVGQGIGNIMSGLFGGLPGAGATMRTLVNVRAGGTSQLSGALHSLLLLLIVVGFGSVAGKIPLAVLAGILVKVGIDIIDWHYLKKIFTAPRSGVVIMLTTLLMTVLVDLITAVAVGFVMASAVFVSQMAKAQLKSAKFIVNADELNSVNDEENKIITEAAGRIVLFQMEGPLSFGSARDIAKLMESDLSKDVLAIDMSRVPFIDGSACVALEEVIERLNEAGDTVLMFSVREDVQEVLKRTGILAQLTEKNVFENRLNALRIAKAIVGKKSGAIKM